MHTFLARALLLMGVSGLSRLGFKGKLEFIASMVPGDANHCAVSLSTSSSVSTAAGPGVFWAIDSPMLELPREDKGGLDAELDEDVSSGTEDDNEETSVCLPGSGEAVRAAVEMVSGGPVSTEPARDTEVEDDRDNDIARWYAEVGGSGGKRASADTAADAGVGTGIGASGGSGGT